MGSVCKPSKSNSTTLTISKSKQKGVWDIIMDLYIYLKVETTITNNYSRDWVIANEITPYGKK